MSIDPLAAWNGSNWRRFGALQQIAVVVAAMLLSSVCAQSAPLRAAVLRAICASGVVAATYGIIQYFGMDPILPPASYEAGQGIFRIVRPPGPLGHSDYFAAWLLWPFFMGAAMSLTEERKSWKRFGLLSLFVTGTSLVLTGSRGAILGLAVGLTIYAAMARVRVRTVSAVLFLATLAFSVFFVSPAGQGLRARAHWIADDRTGGARPLLWRDSVRMSLARPWIGFGPDLFAAEFPKYQSTELARAYPDFYHESPHNSVLDALTGAGIVGALALLLVFGTGIRAGFDPAPDNRALAGVLVSALVGVFVAQQFTVFTAPTALYFYLGSGLLAGLSQEKRATASFSSTYRLAYAATSFAIATVLAICGVRLLVADHSLAVAKHSLDVGDIPSAVRALQSAAVLRTTGVNADLYFSRRWAVSAIEAHDPLARAQLSQFARDAAVNGTECSEQRQNAWYNMALLAAGNNDMPGAEVSLRAAILWAPKWFKPHWSLARVLFISGRAKEARAEAALALNLNAGKDSEVTSTLIPILRSQKLGE
jgi:O-antigen ligase